MTNKGQKKACDWAGLVIMVWVSLWVHSLTEDRADATRIYFIVFGSTLLLRLLGYIEGRAAEAVMNEELEEKIRRLRGGR